MTMNATNRGAGRVWRALAAVLVLGLPSPVLAEVIEIAPDGSITVHDRPALVTTQGAAAIEAPSPHQGSRNPPAPLRTQFEQAGSAAALSPDLVEAVAWAESRFNQGARSRAGALGVMQLMPATAAQLGVNPADMAQNVHGGTAYLRQMLDAFDGDITLALAAYNAGPGAVANSHGVPPYAETQRYIAAVLGRLAGDIPEEGQ
jgi:soluble lytic murein transglycosylase-like protein